LRDVGLTGFGLPDLLSGILFLWNIHS